MQVPATSWLASIVLFGVSACAAAEETAGGDTVSLAVNGLLNASRSNERSAEKSNDRSQHTNDSGIEFVN